MKKEIYKILSTNFTRGNLSKVTHELFDLFGVSNRAEVISDIVKALKNDEPNYVFKNCSACKGKGYTHGYGTHSIEPDWCDECGGPGEVVDEDATHLVKLQIVSKVLKEHGY
jgi:hypothetical protein